VVSRSEGYRRGAGKERLALDIAAEFFGGGIGIELIEIDDPDENYLLGDWRSPSGETIECKGQPIDPTRYPLNFVEIFEVTENPRHRGGFEDLAELLGIPPTLLEEVTVTLPDRSAARLGRPPYVSISVRSIYRSAFTVYVNYLDGGRWIYVYERGELTDRIAAAVRRGGLLRGAGKSNEDTFAVKLPIPRARWRRSADFGWTWTGEGSEVDATSMLEQVLGTAF
jgi:hypothetical protein